MGFFAKLFGGKDSAPASPLRAYIDGHLPKNYTHSKKYAVSLLESGQRAVAAITLDMEADGSDFGGFGGGDFAQLAELEAGYLLSECLKEPPVPVDFTLRMDFGGGRVATVERQNGAEVGFLTWDGQRRQIIF